MSVLEIKSHFIQYQVTTPGYEDENGDYHSGASEWSEELIECDAVPAGKADERTFEDGSVSKYSFTIYLPANCREFSIGDRVRLHRHGKTYEFSVKGFIPYQHQTKIWIG